jgi:hypothetical protein
MILVIERGCSFITGTQLFVDGGQGQMKNSGCTVNINQRRLKERFGVI